MVDIRVMILIGQERGRINMLTGFVYNKYCEVIHFNSHVSAAVLRGATRSYAANLQDKITLHIKYCPRSPREPVSEGRKDL